MPWKILEIYGNGIVYCEFSTCRIGYPRDIFLRKFSNAKELLIEYLFA